MWGIWKTTPETEQAYCIAERMAALRGVTMAALIDELVADYAQTPFCGECGSFDLRYCDEVLPTGVVAPDGYEERRREEWAECRKCGAKQ